MFPDAGKTITCFWTVTVRTSQRCSSIIHCSCKPFQCLWRVRSWASPPLKHLCFSHLLQRRQFGAADDLNLLEVQYADKEFHCERKKKSFKKKRWRRSIAGLSVNIRIICKIFPWTNGWRTERPELQILRDCKRGKDFQNGYLFRNINTDWIPQI